MLLEIRHRTEFQYSAMVRESVMELWVQPQRSHRQRLVSFELEIDPAAQLFSYADPFGNAVYHFDVPHPHDRLKIHARSAVETEPLEPLPEALDMGEWDRLRSEFMHGEWFDFLGPHGYAVQTDALAEFSKTHGINDLRHNDPLNAVRALNRRIYEALEYQPGVTEADSPIDDALNAGRGVCQDFAHIMIAICRSWGLPTRYVSGYLFTDQSGGDRSDPDATHAWVEVFLPSLRWVGLDPTNNALAGERHVIVATGRDYGDVPPTKGVFKGDADSELSVGVSVRQARVAASEPEFLRMGRAAASAGRRRHASALALDHQLQQQQ